MRGYDYRDAMAWADRGWVLVAEDDGPSGRFFETALTSMGCRVDLAISGHSALAQARDHAYALLLLDRHLPDSGAEDILATLRADAAAASCLSPALATSAELDTAQRKHLRALGFADILLKPVGLAALKAMLDIWLPLQPGIAEPVLDDASGLGSSGTTDALAALRELFIPELESLRRDLDQNACQDNQAFGECLHRLLASCSLCGAPALGDAVRKLKRQLDAGAPISDTDLQAFRALVSTTIAALHAPE